MNIQLKDIQSDIEQAVRIALAEDIGSGDITAELIPASQTNQAKVITREDCIVCGQAWFDEVFRQLDPGVSIAWHIKEGERAKANDTLVSLKGNSRSLLTGERSALNFLQLLSGVATKAREYADLVQGSEIKVLDTRKTIPGLRTAQKYAVTVGGCHNHRIGLYDAYLIKENHIAACGGITPAVKLARQLHPEKPVIVEVENMRELEEAVACEVDRVMLDNFADDKAMDLSAQHPSIAIETSGNMTMERIKALSVTRPLYCSLGELTKQVKSIDLSMRVNPV